MNRFSKIAVAGAFAFFIPAATEAQQVGQSQAPQTGQAPQIIQTSGQSTYNGGYGQTPWFSNPQIRQQFNLTDQQYNQLNKGYGESYNRYQQGLNGLGKDLTPAERSQRMANLQQGFYKDFSGNTNSVLQAEQQQRYNQLYTQYQGYNSFTNPAVQTKLNLTAEQRVTLNQYQQDWHNQMNALGQGYQPDNVAATSKYNELRKQSADRMNAVLTPDQRAAWQQMTGQPYNFPASMYFQNNTGATKNP